MRKQTILSFAVAVLLGLISAQTPPAQAQTTTGFKLPSYATYQGQAGVNQKMASNFGVNVTEWQALNGGFGGPQGMFGGASNAAGFSANAFSPAPLTLASVGGADSASVGTSAPTQTPTGFKLPAYATYQGQAGVNQKMASNFGINVTEWSALNGGFGMAGPGTQGMLGANAGFSANTFSPSSLTLVSVGGGAAATPAPGTPAMDPVLTAKIA